MHIDLLKAIPLDLRERLDEEFAFLLRLRAMEVHAMWPRCWKIITLYTNDELVIQSCKQYLSHHQCVISTLLFGLSLSEVVKSFWPRICSIGRNSFLLLWCYELINELFKIKLFIVFTCTSNSID